jgi:hypothetical protein
MCVIPRKIPISGTVHQARAKEVTENLCKSDFKASNRWLKCFKNRKNIVFRDSYGKTDANENSVAECLLLKNTNQ